MALLIDKINFNLDTDSKGSAALDLEVRASSPFEIEVVFGRIKKGQKLSLSLGGESGEHSRLLLSGKPGESSFHIDLDLSNPSASQTLTVELSCLNGSPVNIFAAQWSANGTVFVHGGCTSRDTFNFSSAPPMVDYRARSSLVAAFDPNIPFANGVDLSENKSAFQRRMIETEFSRALPKLLDEASFDLFLIDLLIERASLCWVNGAIVTRSAEFVRAELDQYVDEVFDNNSDEYFRLFTQSWANLVGKLGESTVAVNRIFWSSHFDTGEETTNHRTVIKQNARLRKLYSIIEKTTPGINWITYTPELLTAFSGHKWGPAPYHFGDDLYRSQSRMISELIRQQQELRDGSEVSSKVVLDLVVGRVPVDRSVAFSFKRRRSSFNLGMHLQTGRDIGCRNMLVSFDLSTIDGKPVPADASVPGMSVSPHPQIGWYSYVETPPGQVHWYKMVTLPPGVVCHGIRLVRWGNRDSDITLKHLYLDSAAPQSLS